MKQLTVIIPFRNEKEQVYKTCESFNRYCNPALFDILCINDCSDDRYDYASVTRFDNVTLLDNTERLGVAGCRDKGAKQCATTYILLIDGHMRVFGDVVTPLLEKLRAYPGDLLCCQSKIIKYNAAQNGYELEKMPRTKGVVLETVPDLSFLEYQWQQLDMADAARDVIPIPCCMGACYAMRREHYLHLHGLNGLQQWGMDEQFLSAKTWMYGGNVLLLKNIEIAHIYRQGTPIPYRSFEGVKILNKLIMVYLLADNKLFCEFNNNIKDSLPYLLAKDIIDIFDDLLPFLNKEKTYLSLILKYDFEYFLNLSRHGYR